MIKLPTNKIREQYGIAYYLELKHILLIRQKYNIIIDRKELNKRYNIKQYIKQI